MYEPLTTSSNAQSLGPLGYFLSERFGTIWFGYFERSSADLIILSEEVSMICHGTLFKGYGIDISSGKCDVGTYR